MTALIAVAVVLGGCADVSSDRGRVRVPRLVGVRGTEAICRLDARHLRWREGRAPVRSAPRVPCAEGVHVSSDGIVRRQDPAAGTLVEAGSIVRFETACSLAARRGRPCQ